MDKKSYEVQVLHTPYEKQDCYGALSMPIYQSVAYDFESAEAMEEAFCGRSADYAYSRISNPTVQHFEERIRRITGAYSVTALNSGMAAISNALLCVTWAGCNIVTSSHLFGNTWSFMVNTLGAYDVEIRFFDLSDPDALRLYIDENTAVVFLEAITNPQLEVVDLEMVSGIAHQAGVPVMVDSTIVPFPYFKGCDFGIDIEVISSTKYISGGATSLGGIILDMGNFDWAKSPRLGKVESASSKEAFTYKLRKEIHRNLGAYMTPQVAYMQTLGLETLMLRFERQATTCLHLAQKLCVLSAIERVNYPGLEENPFYELSNKQFNRLPGAMLTFDLSSREACFKMMNRLQLIRRATNLFDNKSLAIHPASTIYGGFDEDQRIAMDISQKTIRLSVGLESADELFEDIRNAVL
ncbi:MAG: PLP-dependent transferase [Bacteroidales bacterium]